MQFPQFVQFAHMTGTKKAAPDSGGEAEQAIVAAAKDKTPEELIGVAYQMLHSALKKEILDLV
jgi:hypothetical protein